MLSALDHFVLTTGNIDVCVDFYTRVLRMQAIQFGSGRTALHFGTQKINLHQAGEEFKPHALYPQSGSLDLCFLLDISLDEAIQHLQQCNIHIEEGPVLRTGAQSRLSSIYIRDPDENLIELAVQLC